MKKEYDYLTVTIDESIIDSLDSETQLRINQSLDNLANTISELKRQKDEK